MTDREAARVTAAVETVLRQNEGSGVFVIRGLIRAALSSAGTDALDRERAKARDEVKAAVEEWFIDVSLDDLFSVKGWDRAPVPPEDGGA